MLSANAAWSSAADGAAASATAVSARERARRRVVTLVFALYLIAILEGALRKWVAPQFATYIFFLRDPVLLLAYGWALAHALWPRMGGLFATVIAMSGLGVVWIVLQAAVGGYSELRLILAVYGWRSYFLYVPLAFLVAAVFRREDLMRLCRLTLWLAVPVAVLVTLQFFSPPGAPINVGIAADEEYQFRGLGLTGERTRPMGPFASGAGQQQFVATAFAILLAMLALGRSPQRPAWPTMAIAGAAIAVCIGLSGSRGAVLQCALSVVFAGGLVLIGRGGGTRLRAFLWPALLVPVALVLYPLVLPEGHEAFTSRWTAAAAAESRSFELGVFGRTLYGFVDFFRLVPEVPALGYGLGYGGNASITLGATVDGIRPGLLAETDFARHMVDLGPLFGVGYIVFRFAVAGWLVALVVAASRRAPDPLPMLLLSYVLYTMVLGQITGQGTINFYCWLFTGLLIASCQAGPVVRRAVLMPARVHRPRRYRGLAVESRTVR